MFRRSRCREVALQLLYQQDQNKKPMSATATARFIQDRVLNDAASIAFCKLLFEGVQQHRAAIDAVITATAVNWRLSRMLPSDRNVIRLATFELLHSSEAEPVAIIINEALELARRFGTVDSAGFVNGLLDQIALQREAPKELPKSAVALVPAASA